MKPIRRIFAAALLLALLSGCTIPSGDELLAAPRPDRTYQTLQLELEKVLAGSSYAAPLSGDNRSNVQLVDLDGDGVDEAVSFFKQNGNSNEFSVYLYKKQDDTYVCTGTIAGTGTGIQSVDYPAMTPSGRRGVVIAWQLASEGTGAVTVCDLDANCAPAVLLETEYSAMELADLDGDGARDLLLIAGDQTGKRVAQLYRYQDGKLVSSEAATSADAVAVSRMFSGRVGGGQSAVFAEQRTASGVGQLTDLFVFTNGALQNLALDSEDSSSRGTYRPVSIDATDINADGTVEVPRAVLMAGYDDASSTDAVYMLDWYVYSVSGEPTIVQTTYHNVSEGWFLTIDPAWHDSITADKAGTGGLSETRFYETKPNGDRLPVFTIFCATGAMREYYAAQQDLIQLGTTRSAAYCARIENGSAYPTISVDADSLQALFSLMTTAWSS